MGLPLTWITLSALHIYYVFKAAERTFKESRGKEKKEFGNDWLDRGLLGFLKTQPFRICGDDLIGVWTPNFRKNYEKVIIEHGGKFSAGKHYVSK